MYLTEDVVKDQLAALAAASGVGSRLSSDFYPSADAGTSQDRRLMRAQRVARAGSGEQLRLHVDRSQAGELLAASGWDVEELTSVREAALKLVPDHLGLPLRAINEHKTLAAGTNARRP